MNPGEDVVGSVVPDGSIFSGVMTFFQQFAGQRNRHDDQRRAVEVRAQQQQYMNRFALQQQAIEQQRAVDRQQAIEKRQRHEAFEAEFAQRKQALDEQSRALDDGYEQLNGLRDVLQAVNRTHTMYRVDATRKFKNLQRFQLSRQRVDQQLQQVASMANQRVPLPPMPGKLI